MANKPTAAFVLGLIGGILVLAVSAYILSIIATVTALAGSYGVSVGGLFGLVTWYFYLGVVSGLLMIVSSVMLFAKPKQHTIWGALLLVFSIVSLISGGGFFLGFILGLIGGILGLIFKPMAGMMAGAPMGMPGQAPPGAMTCPYCGGAVNPATRTCTMCGKAVP